jgi:hypothetical protein
MAIRRQVPKEHHEQAAFMTRLAWLRPNLTEFVAAIPNGGKRDRIVAARLKREGVRPGFPDVIVMLPRQGAHALLIEFKRQGVARAGDEQHALHALYRAQGYRVELCSGCDAAWRVFEEYVAS